MKNYNQKKFVFAHKMLMLTVSLLCVFVLIGCGTKEDSKKVNENNNVDDNYSYDETINGKLDKNVNLTYDENGAFLFPIEDVFTITDRGTVVTGTVVRGKINIGDTVQIIGLDQKIITTTVISIDKFRSENDYAIMGDEVGLILKDVERNQVQRGQVLAQPNSIISSKKFEAEITLYTSDVGGRKTPIYNEYQPEFHFETIGIKGKTTLLDGVDSVNPGESAKVMINLETSVAMEKGMEISIREGGKTVGSGKITRVY